MSYLYAVSSPHTNRYGTIKLGCTSSPIHRMRVYNTGDAPDTDTEKRYSGLWLTTATTMRELLRCEKLLHAHFAQVRRKRRNGNYSEWFDTSLSNVATFVKGQSWFAREVTLSEIQEIHERAEQPIREGEEKEYERELAAVSSNTSKGKSLLDKFFSTFLPSGAAPRRNQLELWDIYEEITATNTPYRGIVQWITGAGKTIAMLLMIVLSLEACKKNGELYRGLLIVPKNDILDTIIHHIRKLSIFGIQVYEGHNARLSSLQIPTDRHILVTATHASLTDDDAWNRLPPMNHVHYDEVHRITGDEFFRQLLSKLPEWVTRYLTGTSATPKTCSPSQQKKLLELFGDPLPILHRCDVDEAIYEGWIAQPRFGVNIIPDTLGRAERIQAFLNIIQCSISQKQSRAQWIGGKSIAYLSTREEVRIAVSLAKTSHPNWIRYSAVEETADADDDEAFVAAPVDGTVRVLFACERFREGSDIRGLEMIALLMGNSISANIVIQMAGRALRLDYPGKEGWCVIVRPSEEGTTEDDVLDSIVLQIMEILGEREGPVPSSSRVRSIVSRFFADVTMSGRVYDVEETIQRIQALYLRRAFARSDPKERYVAIQAINREMGLVSKIGYEASAAEHPKYIENPRSYFKDSWVSWYDFLGVDTAKFPATKQEWKIICIEKGIRNSEEYKKNIGDTLPENPLYLYENFTDINAELGWVDDEVW